MDTITAPATVSPAERAICDRASFDGITAVHNGIEYDPHGNVAIVDAKEFAAAYGLPVTHERAKVIIAAWPTDVWQAWDAAVEDERTEGY